VTERRTPDLLIKGRLFTGLGMRHHPSSSLSMAYASQSSPRLPPASLFTNTILVPRLGCVPRILAVLWLAAILLPSAKSH